MLSKDSNIYWVVLCLLCLTYSSTGTDANVLFGTVRNLTVFAFEEVKNLEYSPLKLNISWLSPEDNRQPSSYSILLSTIANSNKCFTNSLYYTTKNANQLNAILPERRFFTDVSELSIISGCSYKIEVLANPRIHLTKHPPTVIYTVPECIRRKCCSIIKEKFSKPQVNATVLNNRHILIKWNSDKNDSKIYAFIISFGTPLLKSKNGLLVYNKTIIHKTTAKDFSYNWLLQGYNDNILYNNENRIFVTAEDAEGCPGKEGSSPIYFMAKDSEITISFGIMGLCVIIIGIISLFRMYYIKKYSIISLHQSGKLSSVNMMSICTNQQFDSLLKNRNVLYVEREIEEALQKGDVDKYEVSFNRIKITRELGKGQFGKVYLAILEGQQDTIIAVKMSLCSEPSFVIEARQQLLEEIATMKIAGQHPHLMSLIGCCTLPESPICLILEYMEGGDLLAYLHRLKNNVQNNHLLEIYKDTTINKEIIQIPTDNINHVLGRKEILRFTLEIVRGMEHLEAKGIIHRDLAARNVLLTSNLTLKIADFGLSRNGVYIMGNRAGGVRCLPVRWMSPESVYDRAFSSKSDVWSFAVVLWEIGTLGTFPYPNMTDEQLLKYVLNGGRLEKPSIISRELYHVMCICWASRARDRPSFAQLLRHIESMYECRHIFDGTSNPCCLLLPPAAQNL